MKLFLIITIFVSPKNTLKEFPLERDFNIINAVWFTENNPLYRQFLSIFINWKADRFIKRTLLRRFIFFLLYTTNSCPTCIRSSTNLLNSLWFHRNFWRLFAFLYLNGLFYSTSTVQRNEMRTRHYGSQIRGKLCRSSPQSTSPFFQSRHRTLRY